MRYLTVDGKEGAPGRWLANDALELIDRFETVNQARKACEHPGDHVVEIHDDGRVVEIL